MDNIKRAYEPSITSETEDSEVPIGGNDGAAISQNLQILLVEDDDADAYLIRRALAANPRVGTIVRARDGVEALDLIDNCGLRPDLAILDLQMPRKNGFSLLVELEDRVTVDFPSVVFTSSKSGADSLRSRKRGATMFVTKPKRLEKLAEALDNVLAAAA